MGFGLHCPALLFTADFVALGVHLHLANLEFGIAVGLHFGTGTEFLGPTNSQHCCLQPMFVLFSWLVGGQEVLELLASLVVVLLLVVLIVVLIGISLLEFVGIEVIEALTHFMVLVLVARLEMFTIEPEDNFLRAVLGGLAGHMDCVLGGHQHLREFGEAGWLRGPVIVGLNMQWNAETLYAHNGVLLVLLAVEFWILDCPDTSGFLDQSAGLLNFTAVGHWQGMGSEQFGVSFWHFHFGLKAVLFVVGEFSVQWNVGLNGAD